nr:MAG TPA: hypothetical protein [Caudoviricetes sp.]
MFSYSLFVDSLIKAMGHKYVRRIPKGTTKTGKTKYVYFYAGQENRGQGIGHESELVQGASFAMGQGDQRHHAHISKVDGDKITVKYDDGAKKGTEETMTKKQFQSMIQKEHGAVSTQAKQKTTKKPTTQATASSMKQEQISTKPTPSEQPQTTTRSKQEQDALDDKLEKLSLVPIRIQKDKELIKELPGFFYRQNADDVIETYLSDAQLGQQFAGIPNIRKILKEKLQTNVSSFTLNEDQDNELNRIVDNLASRDKAIELSKFPFLLEPSALNKLFDKQSLRRLELDTIQEELKTPRSKK